MPHVAVFGGGVSGLAAAHRLQELARARGTSLDITLYERDAQAGGCVRTVRDGNVLMELGADSLLADKPAARSLLERLDLTREIIDIQPQFKGARIVNGGRLRPLPAQFRLFAPRSIPALLRSGIFSPSGIVRAAFEPFVPPRKSLEDESLASFVTRRLGREFLERLAQPLIGGIYSADPARLSMNMALPQFVEYERQYGSILRALAQTGAQTREVRLVSLRGGMGQLTAALAARLDGRLRTGCSIGGLIRAENGWRFPLSDGTFQHVDAVVCALPAAVSASLLRPLDAWMAAALEGVHCNSMAVITFQYPAGGVRLPAATGFVVPFAEGCSIVASTFSSQKYPGRAPAEIVLIRVFIGGALQARLLRESDDALVHTARRELSRLLGPTEAPERSLVTRWNDALPEYAVGHAAHMEEVQRRARSVPGLALAGCAYSGVGIPNCVASGEAAAESVFGYVTAAKGTQL